jgi:hypothetical protein
MFDLGFLEFLMPRLMIPSRFALAEGPGDCPQAVQADGVVSWA